MRAAVLGGGAVLSRGVGGVCWWAGRPSAHPGLRLCRSHGPRRCPSPAPDVPQRPSELYGGQRPRGLCTAAPAPSVPSESLRDLHRGLFSCSLPSPCFLCFNPPPRSRGLLLARSAPQHNSHNRRTFRKIPSSSVRRPGRADRGLGPSASSRGFRHQRDPAGGGGGGVQRAALGRGPRPVPATSTSVPCGRRTRVQKGARGSLGLQFPRKQGQGKQGSKRRRLQTLGSE